MDNLQKLNLSRNQISDIKVLENVKFEKLDYLDLIKIRYLILMYQKMQISKN